MQHLKIDQFGRVSEQGIHDATIVGINYSLATSLQVSLRGLDNKVRELYLQGPEKVGFNELVDGTIVSDIYCWGPLQSEKMGRISPESWRCLFGGNFNEQDLPVLIYNTIQKYGGAFLIFIESSYGGSIAAICGDVDYRT